MAEVDEHIKEVEVSSSQKKQFERYEPVESFVGLTATIPEDQDSDEFIEALQTRADELVRQDITRRYALYTAQSEDEEE